MMCDELEGALQYKLRLLDPDIEKEKFNDDGLETQTSIEQIKLEASIASCHRVVKDVINIDPKCPRLMREDHVQFLKKGLGLLPSSLEFLDANRPWMCYWILHSLSLLGEPISEDRKADVIDFLKRCQHPDGGFGGSPGAEPHLAPTYAAVCALCELGTEEAYKAIDRPKLLNFLLEMKNPDGSYKMHACSEADIRGAYCALIVARMTSLWVPELLKNVAEWVASCQTYEGGFGGVPFMEAHGGYTFCGFASLVLLKKEDMCNISSLLRWLVNRQMRFEGGFQGRTNKLVDSCYSFWQCGIFPLLHRKLCATESETMSTNSWLFNQTALQEYILVNCQDPQGGIVDKPGKKKDFYHTCYALSGLSIAQHFASGHLGKTLVVGDPENELNFTHPLSNVVVDAVAKASEYFSELPVPEVKSPHS